MPATLHIAMIIIITAVATWAVGGWGGKFAEIVVEVFCCGPHTLLEQAHPASSLLTNKCIENTNNVVETTAEEYVDKDECTYCHTSNLKEKERESEREAMVKRGARRP